MAAAELAEILGPDGLIVIIVVGIVLLCGGSQIPKLARGLGTASHEFRKGVNGGSTTDASEIGEAERSKAE